MTELQISRVCINLELLNDELDSQYPSLFRGVVFDTGKSIVRVFVDDSASKSQLLSIQAIVENHDPDGLTAGQVAAAARDKLPLFALALTGIDAWADDQTDIEFRRAVTRAFVELRIMVTGE